MRRTIEQFIDECQREANTALPGWVISVEVVPGTMETKWVVKVTPPMNSNPSLIPIDMECESNYVSTSASAPKEIISGIVRGLQS